MEAKFELEDVLPFAGVDDNDYTIFEMLAMRRKKASYDLRLISKQISHITTLLFRSIHPSRYFWRRWLNRKFRNGPTPLFHGRDAWIRSAIRRGYCPNLKRLVVDWLEDSFHGNPKLPELLYASSGGGGALDSARIESKNVLSEVVIFNLVFYNDSRIRDRDKTYAFLVGEAV
ncbi:hypothetical protein M422DRAFT_261524 [Sphaerobolus stellatus SS14]|uniref:Uncharacterized protein n=1 Tax=Sphaerobolus stellatus (strain SS14) TaxID=990650 RepID=A0A0C9U0A4_SPHS4|nr:hypothetical protein M422DRAFT_261524 [Sphaerobolus stellatus SS14]